MCYSNVWKCVIITHLMHENFFQSSLFSSEPVFCLNLWHLLWIIPVSPHRQSYVLISGLCSSSSSSSGRSRRYDTIYIKHIMLLCYTLFIIPTYSICTNVTCSYPEFLTSACPMFAAAIRACCTAWLLLVPFWLQQEVQLQSGLFSRKRSTSRWPCWAARTSTHRPELSMWPI